MKSNILALAGALVLSPLTVLAIEDYMWAGCSPGDMNCLKAKNDKATAPGSKAFPPGYNRQSRRSNANADKYGIYLNERALDDELELYIRESDMQYSAYTKYGCKMGDVQCYNRALYSKDPNGKPLIPGIQTGSISRRSANANADNYNDYLNERALAEDLDLYRRMLV